MAHSLRFLSSLLGLAAAAALFAQSPQVAAPRADELTLNKRAFADGERLWYDASFGHVHVGHGMMLLAGTDTVRGHTAWRAIFTLSGGTFFFHVRDSTVSWFDTTTMSSLRFVQYIREGRYRADRDYQIYPERGTYTRLDHTEAESVHAPLDDASFLYFLRSISLEVGRTYEFDRYFQPEGNPILIRVLRHEQVTVPAGTFNAIVVQPEFRTPGIFSKKGHAEVWLADDSTHMMLMLKSGLSFGSLNLYLTRYSLGMGSTTTGPHRER
ncbi:MAG: DUF3108 domain-containing protein [Gemmatimonadota bacterium]|nr:DUF3108 domain-containing protein [Gemmatimonadota bacterium]